jgi:CBS domain-containing protein
MAVLKTKPLALLTAEDLMSKDLVLIPQEMTLRAAAHRLAASHVSGAPVVDEQARCVGVLSATDFLHWADKNGSKPAPEPICRPWQIVEPTSLPEDVVRNYMTRDPVMVRPTTPVTEVARKMIDAHIHRVIVVDDGGTPEGIVSSTDILAAVAYADSMAGEAETAVRCPHDMVSACPSVIEMKGTLR